MNSGLLKSVISSGIHGCMIQNLNNGYNQIVKIAFIANDNVLQYKAVYKHISCWQNLLRVPHGFNFHLIGSRLISLDAYYHAMKRPPMSRMLLELLQKGLLFIMASWHVKKIPFELCVTAVKLHSANILFKYHIYIIYIYSKLNASFKFYKIKITLVHFIWCLWV